MTIGLAVERSGLPVGVLTDAADGGEPALGRRVLERLPPEAGPPADAPVVADRGFDSDGLRDDLAVAGFRLLAPHRKNRRRPSRNDGRRVRRYVVERTFGWLHPYRRLLVRHEYYAHLYDGFLHLACALIAVGKI